MKPRSYMKPSRSLILVPFFLVISIFACSNAYYTGQYFSFPPGSKPHENDWQYTAVVIVTSNHSPICDKSRKKVKIKIYDKNKIIYLNEDYEFDCASVKVSLVWEKFEDLKLDFDEVGNEFSTNAHNKRLVKTGPIRLISLSYEYDQESRMFRRKPGLGN